MDIKSRLKAQGSRQKKQTRVKCFTMMRNCLLLMIFLSFQLNAEQISDFKSDGCSHFPDGSFKQNDLWCDCCIAHDIAYWQGGSLSQKKLADEALRQCVLDKTSNRLLANSMYLGVTVGGLPIYPIWYRWGFGWSYGRGFKALSANEKLQIEDKLQIYKKSGNSKHCDFNYPLFYELKQRVNRIFD